MNYCSQCGSDLDFRVPPGDTLHRFVCDRCHTIHYENPKIIVGTLPRWGESILLCKRAIEPMPGYWTIPSGFMENGESVEEGALRETREEANAEIRIVRLHTVYSCPHINQVYMIFLAELQNLDFFPGEESQEVQLFDAGQIPYDDLAFSAVRFSIRNYFEKSDEPGIHIGRFPEHGPGKTGP